MPIPTPDAGEDQNTYVSRIIRMMKNEGKPHKQSIAIALDSWRRHSAQKSAGVHNSMNIPWTVTIKEIP